jgi:hypothetical protein
MSTEKTIVTINGIRMEVDLRHATIVHENLQIGSKVKILEKAAYGGPKVYPGVIVGFDAFPSLPTITVAYVTGNYSQSDIAFAAINEKSGDKWELVPSQDDDLPIKRETLLGAFEREILKHQREIEAIEQKRVYFNRMFGAYFADITPHVAAE